MPASVFDAYLTTVNVLRFVTFVASKNFNDGYPNIKPFRTEL